MKLCTPSLYLVQQFAGEVLDVVEEEFATQSEHVVDGLQKR